MQSQFQTEPAERRYRPETVQKAAALAARLQEERRETLSEAEVGELAAEIGIDPKLMRQALEMVARTEVPASTSLRPRKSLAPLGIACLSSGLFLLLFFASLVGIRSAPQASPVMVMTPSGVPVGSPVSGPLLQNGNFELGAASGKGKIAAGSSGLTGWTVENGEVSLLANVPTVGGHALRLGEASRIRQIFRTEPGQIYRVTVSLSGAPGATGRLHRIEAQAGNSSMTPSTFTEPGTGRTGSWASPSFNFRAEEVGTPLTISTAPNEGAGSSAPIIDDIRIEPVVLP